MRRDKTRWCRLVFLVSTLFMPVALLLDAGPVQATHTTIKLPFLGTGAWYAWEGYNYSPLNDGTHWDCDPATGLDEPSETIPCRPLYIYKYSFDLRRVDEQTAFQPVLAPADGVICWIDSLGFGGGAIDFGDGYVFAYFHTRIAGGLEPGQLVKRGQFLGVVAPPGEAGNGGISHLHINLWRSDDCGGADRATVPFTGDHKLDGYDFPALSDSVQNQHVNAQMTPSNVVTGTIKPSTPALDGPGDGVTTHTATPLLSWGTSTRAVEYQVSIDGGATRSPWIEGKRWRPPALAPGLHTWKVHGRNPLSTGSYSATRTFTVPAGIALLTGSSGTGTVDTKVTMRGKGFAPGETIDLTWDDDYLKSKTTTQTGTFATSFHVPPSIKGEHRLIATGRTSGESASFPFVIDHARVVIEPVSGKVRDLVTIRAWGFGEDEPVFIAWDNFITDFGDSSADSNGTFSATAVVPPLGQGEHEVLLIGEVSDQRGAANFEIEPTLLISPSSAPAGTRITMRGRGWPANTPVVITWTPSEGGTRTTVCNGNVSSNGNFSCRFFAPAGVPGTAYRVRAKAGATSKWRTFKLTGVASLATSPTPARSPSVTPVPTQTTTPVPTGAPTGTTTAAETAISSPTEEDNPAGSPVPGNAG